MLYICAMCASCGCPQCCVLHDFPFVNAGGGYERRPYGRGILQKINIPCQCVWYVCCYVRKHIITERMDMGLYEVPFSISLLGFGMGTVSVYSM